MGSGGCFIIVMGRVVADDRLGFGDQWTVDKTKNRVLLSQVKTDGNGNDADGNTAESIKEEK